MMEQQMITLAFVYVLFSAFA